MGETQRSPTISTQSRKIAQQTEPNRVCEEKPPVLVRENSFARIRQSADRQPELVFTALAHHIGESLLKESFRQVRKSEAAGVDQVTAKSYAENLDANLCNPYQRLRRGQYVATPVKRIWIDKEDGKKRPMEKTKLVPFMKFSND